MWFIRSEYGYEIHYGLSSSLRRGVVLSHRREPYTHYTYIWTLRAGDLVQTERWCDIYTPKRIVCLISHPQWVLNDSATVAVVVRSLPRLMTARPSPRTLLHIFYARRKTLYPVIFRSTARQRQCRLRSPSTY
jgi:hypothetical protein